MRQGIAAVVLFLMAYGVMGQDNDEIKLSLDKLFSLKVTSVSGTAMDLKKSPAAIYVITTDDFKKQGHRTIADALRAVPGFHVRKIAANKWAISARGDNGRFANKLLVLIDGRSVYTPLFSGVYWEIQDLALEDIDRIEVIRGPGATLWGANAVNGVINIVTKNVRDTLGGYVKLGLGNVDHWETEYRYGWQMSDNVFARVWGKNFDRGESETSTGLDANDSWDGGHFGMKLDWYATPLDTHSFQANYSKLNVGGTGNLLDFFGELPSTAVTRAAAPTLIGLPLFNGQTRRSTDTNWTTANAMWTWTKSLSSSSGWTFKTYYDFTDTEDDLFAERRDTFDIDFRHWFNINKTNSFIWGLNFRTTEDDIKGSDTVYLLSPQRRINTYSGFVQNTTKITDKLSLMYGSKLEWNDQTGVEIQPSVRLTYDYTDSTTLWASWSRAVRRPSRAEDDVRLFQLSTNTTPNLAGIGFASHSFKTIGGFLAGSRDQDSEELLAYEMGMRTDYFDKKIIIDFATFFFDYNNLVGLETDPSNSARQNINNKGNAHAYGAELSLKYIPTDKLDFLFNYTWFRKHGELNEEADAEHLLFTAMNYKICKDLSWHTTVYYAGNVESINTKSYINLDTGFIWKYNAHWDFSVWGKNLLDPQHAEGTTEYFDDQTYQIPRSLFFQATYRF